MKERILYLPGFSPFSTVGGGNQRSHFLLKALAEKFDVDVWVDFECADSQHNMLGGGVNVLPVTESSEVSSYEKISRRLRLLLNPFSAEQLEPTNLQRYRQIHQLIRKKSYKYVVVRYLFMIPYHRLYNLSNLVVDIDDIPSLRYKTLSLSGDTRSIGKMLKYEVLKIIEKRLTAKAVCSFLPDKSMLQKFNRCYYLPNIPLNIPQIISRTPHNKIIFVGSMTQQMNYEGVNRFVSDIFPKIKHRHPNLEFHIIGKGTPEFLVRKWQLTPNVIVRGFVDDLTQEYSEARCTIAPIYSGAGTNIKVLEALGHGCPTVVSEFALRGFEQVMRDGVHLLVAKDDTAFAEAVNALLDNPKVAEDLGRKGHEIVASNFGFSAFRELALAPLV